MTSLLAGRVALVTGAPRGQGRSHAARVAREGASITIGIAGPAAAANAYPAATVDREEPRRCIQTGGAPVVAWVVGVRNGDALSDVLADGLAEFGRLDVVVGNAGVGNWAPFWEVPDDQWLSRLGYESEDE